MRLLCRLHRASGTALVVVALVALAGCNITPPWNAAPRPAVPPSAAQPPAANPPPPAAPPAAQPAAPVSSPAPAAQVPSALPKVSDARIVVSQAADADTLDPILISSTNSRIISRLIMEPLVETDPFTAQPLARLATEWRPVNDTTWEFKLRTGVKFHNGDTMTAEDVAFSFNRILTEPKNRLFTHKQVVKEAKVVDPQTVHVVTQRVFPAFLDAIVSSVYVVPKKVVEREGIDNFNVNSVGTGPYRFVEWRKDDRLTITRFDGYWRDPAPIKDIVFRPIPNNATRVAELETGGVDLIVNTPPDEVERLKKIRGVRVEQVPTLRTIYIGMNTSSGKAEAGHDALRDVRVRQAIQKAIDLDAIVKDVLSGNGTPIASSLTKENFGFNFDLKPIRYDPEGAKKLLAEAGYPNGITVDFNVPQGRYILDKEVGEAVAGQLAKAGIRTNLMVEPWKGYYDKYLGLQFKGLYLLGVGKEFVPDTHFFTYYHSDGRGFYFRDKEVDALIDRASSSLDDKVRIDTFRELQKQLVDKAVWANLYQQWEVYGIRERIRGFKGTSDEQLWLYEAWVD